MSAFCLEMHAGYRCRHAGACCTSGWPIAVELPVAQAITAHFGPSARDKLVWDGGGLPSLATTPDGSCVFFDAANGRLCRIHRDLGAPALPSACRHFPRVVLADARGLHVSLSHFCPTAAAMLFDGPVARIVDAPETLTLGGTAEGLDARDALPPLLSPGMLMDIEAYDAWERQALAMLADGGWPADEVLDILDTTAGALATWRPGQGALVERVRETFATAEAERVNHQSMDGRQAYQLAAASVPDGMTVPPFPESRDLTAAERLWTEHDRVVRRYLAARLFGNWFAYFVHGLHSVVRAMRVHAKVLRVEIERRAGAGTRGRDVVLEAVRATDLLMVHYSDPRALSALIEQAV